MKVFIGSDHAGFHLKETLKKFLGELGHEVEDKGAFSFEEGDDYPDFIIPVAEAVSQAPEDVRGIVLGGSGQGEAMLANKYPGVRADVYYGGSEEIITLSRAHNNANVLALAGRFLTEHEAKRAVELWLRTEFSGEARHARRLAKFPDENL